jgi:acyl-CoA thioesterase FadM
MAERRGATASRGAEITVPYRVRFDECGPAGIVRTSALLRYAQDAAWIHSESLGFDRAWYDDRGINWVVRAAELSVELPIPLGTTLAVTTRVIGFRKVWARRRTEARMPDGGLAMWGHTDWVTIDARGRPIRVPAEFAVYFEAQEETFVPGRVPLPDTPSGARSHCGAVRPQDLDPMGHVNNAAYLDYLEEAMLALPNGPAVTAALPRRLRIEYLASAEPGDELTGAIWQLPDDGLGDASAADAWAWRLEDRDARELARARLSHPTADGATGRFA